MNIFQTLMFARFWAVFEVLINVAVLVGFIAVIVWTLRAMGVL